MSKIQIHGVSLSPFVRKVRVALAEKGIEYEQIPVMPFGQTDEYRAISPLGKIPCLQEGDFTLPDSSVIIAYLERKQPEPPLYPSDDREFARALWYEEYADGKIAGALTTVFFQRFVRAKILGEEPDEAAVQQALTEEVPPIFDYLEKELEGREFLAGGQFSIADIATCSFFVNFEHGGEKVDAARWPGLDAYVQRVHGRPSFKAIIEEEKAG